MHSCAIKRLEGKQLFFSLSLCRTRQQYTANSFGFNPSENIRLGNIKKFLFRIFISYCFTGLKMGCIFILSLTIVKADFSLSVHGLIENLSPYYYKSRFLVKVDTLMRKILSPHLCKSSFLRQVTTLKRKNLEIFLLKERGERNFLRSPLI